VKLEELTSCANTVDIPLEPDIVASTGDSVMSLIRIAEVKSASSSRLYVISRRTLVNGVTRWECACPAWTRGTSQDNDGNRKPCKHIFQVQMNSASVDPEIVSMVRGE
jgi:hypothetical protein